MRTFQYKFRIYLIIAIASVLISGFAYRTAAVHLKRIETHPVKLPIPLSEFPMQHLNWQGREAPVQESVEKYMRQNFADDYISRTYINTETGKWVNLYIVYCSSKPAGIFGHRPRICYPGSGWIHDNTENSFFITRLNHRIPCLIHQFHKPAPHYDRVNVLNYYMVNGSFTSNEEDFSNLLSRRPNVEGNPSRYVSQIQFSSSDENTIQEAAAEFTDLVTRYLPDTRGAVRATE